MQTPVQCIIYRHLKKTQLPANQIKSSLAPLLVTRDCAAALAVPTGTKGGVHGKRRGQDQQTTNMHRAGVSESKKGSPGEYMDLRSSLRYGLVASEKQTLVIIAAFTSIYKKRDRWTKASFAMHSSIIAFSHGQVKKKYMPRPPIKPGQSSHLHLHIPGLTPVNALSPLHARSTQIAH